MSGWGGAASATQDHLAHHKLAIVLTHSARWDFEPGVGGIGGRCPFPEVTRLGLAFCAHGHHLQLGLKGQPCPGPAGIGFRFIITKVTRGRIGVQGNLSAQGKFPPFPVFVIPVKRVAFSLCADMRPGVRKPVLGGLVAAVLDKFQVFCVGYRARGLASDHPDLNIIAICADYTKPFELPAEIEPGPCCTGFFPGSTIGNMTPDEATSFLRHAGTLLGSGAGFIIGVDLKKDPAILHAAYNDSQGVTADFNMNILRRINAELGGDFDLSNFRHRAIYNTEAGRIEMHLVSLGLQTVQIGGQTFEFNQGESIHTENSYKFIVAEFQALAMSAGLEPVKAWWDKDALFSIHFLRVR